MKIKKHTTKQPVVKEEITRKIRKYLEMDENGNKNSRT